MSKLHRRLDEIERAMNNRPSGIAPRPFDYDAVRLIFVPDDELDTLTPEERAKRDAMLKGGNGALPIVFVSDAIEHFFGVTNDQSQETS